MSEIHPNQEQQKETLAEQIAALVGETFALRRQVVLLSYLGQALNKRGFHFREILGEEKLADFIRARLDDRVKVIATPVNPLIWAAYPADVALDKEIDPFGLQKSPPRESSPPPRRDKKRELVAHKVWFAFSHVLGPEFKRIVILDPVIDYKDYDPKFEAGLDGIEVPRELIVPSGSLPREERDQRIYDNINGWATDNGVPFRRLLEERTDTAASRNALDILLASLNESDLAQISVPLDIIARLRKKLV